MPSLSTIEIRWFPSSQPFSLDRYFRDEHRAPVRTDWYAHPNGNGSGVKIREGRLEMKLRSDTLGEFDYSPTATGIVETWTKWGAELDPQDSPADDILNAARWIEVVKERYVRRFQVSDDAITETTERVAHGCSFELTKLVVREQVYWTTGFEAVTDASTNLLRFRESLGRVIAKIEQEAELTALRLDDSCGYPEWLSRNFEELS